MNAKIRSLITLLIAWSMVPVLLDTAVEEAQGASPSPIKWQRYASNPVITCGAVNNWDDAEIQTHCVLWDSSEYKMYYTGSDGSNYKIGLATSTDGKSWAKYASNPILTLGGSTSWENKHVGGAYIINDGGTYKMWYHGNNGSSWQIGYATSADGKSWTKYSGNPVMGVGANGNWDELHVFSPCVISENGGYRMWFGGQSGSTTQLGYANSTDGINWTKNGSNPVLKVGAAGSWESLEVSTPNIINISGSLRLWYGARDGKNWGIGYATSSDGIAWTKYGSNPIMARAGNGWESHDVLCPAVYLNGTNYRMWYTGVDSSSVFKFGLAEGLNTIPNTPSISAPSDNVWTKNNQPTFNWTFSDPNSQDSQTAYQVQLDNENSFGSIDYDTGKVLSAATSFTPDSGYSDNIYYWRMRVWDSDDDNSTWSTTRTVKIDTTAPSNPTAVTSPSHAISTWSNDATIDVSFSGGSDQLSGLDGFSYSWDYSQTAQPDSTKDIEETVQSRSSPSLTDSTSVFFHIRSIDNAGNVATGTAEMGPFWIDSTPPVNPGVTSATHSAGVWSNATVCVVNWSGADGSISGVNGFSVVWDGSAATLPDTATEQGPSSDNLTSGILPDGTWYFHIRTVDLAGNWAPGAGHFGPVLVDSTPPCNPAGIWSTDHALGVWSGDPTIDIRWSAPDANLSGVGGYSFIWDTQCATVPDETKDGPGDELGTSSPALSDGDAHYFHMRVMDIAGNWNASVEHIGPFWLDSTPPANPVAVQSTSHKIGNWSNDSTIDLSWSVGDDGGRLSGYDGFSVVWDTSGSTLPDTTADLDANATSLSSPPLQDSDNIYFHIRALDRAGNWAPDAVHVGPFCIDSTPPGNPAFVSSPSHKPMEWSSDNTIDIVWSGADGSISGLLGYSVVWDERTTTIPPLRQDTSGGETGCTSPALADGETWYIHIRAGDLAGNWAPGAIHLGPFRIDTTPPRIRAFTIDGGAPCTADPGVTLGIEAEDQEPGSGLGMMRASQQGVDWTDWLPFSRSMSFTLKGSDGMKTILVQVRDGVQNVCPDGAATIMLDRRPPSNLTLSINNGSRSTNRTAVTLTVKALDPEPGSGVSHLSISENPSEWPSWIPYCSTVVFNLTPGDGKKQVFVKLRDLAGNPGSVTSGEILLDTAPPSGLSFMINGGATSTNRQGLLLAIQCKDPDPSSGLGWVRLAEDNAIWGDWLPFAPMMGYTLSAGDGLRAVHLMVRDLAGNAAAPVRKTILLDTTPPLLRSAQVTGISSELAVVSWYADEHSNGTVDSWNGQEWSGVAGDPSFMVDHSLIVRDLAPNTDYRLRIRCWDVYGNGPSLSPELSFRTAKRVDEKPPAIRFVKVEQTTDRTALIFWETDEPADSLVEYGLSGSLGGTYTNGSYLTQHRVLLTSLYSASTYYFRVKSTDPSGNGPAASSLMTFSTTAFQDTSPPHLIAVTAGGVTDRLAVVTWATDEPATTLLEIGQTSNYTRSFRSDDLTIQHSVIVNSLLPGTRYHFRAGSKDADGNGPSFSPDLELTTGLTGDTRPPVIITVRVISVGRTNLTIEVELDEPATLVLRYGTSTRYGRTASSPQVLTLHRLSIGVLEPQTTYHFRAEATDPAGNGPTVGPDGKVRTKAALTPSPEPLVNSSNIGPMVALVIIVMAALITYGLARSRPQATKPAGGTPAPESAGLPAPADGASPKAPRATPARRPSPANAGRPGVGQPPEEGPAPASIHLEAPIRPPAPEQPQLPPTAAREAPAGRMTVVETVFVDNLLEDDEPPGRDGPALEPPPDGRPTGQNPSHNDVLKALSSLPRGLPSTLWGIDMDDLAEQVSRSEYRISTEGDAIVRLGARWYYGDPKDIGRFLQLYRGTP